MTKDALILLLCDRLAICSSLLTRAAERLGWDAEEVRELVAELREAVQRESGVSDGRLG